MDKHRPISPQRKKQLAWTALVIFVLLTAAVCWFVGRPMLRFVSEPEKFRLWVDGPAAGDVMCPLGMQGRSKKLSDLINEARVPLAERAGVPVVRSSPGGAIAWVAGVRADERFKCTPTSSMLVKLTIRPIGDV